MNQVERRSALKLGALAAGLGVGSSVLSACNRASPSSSTGAVVARKAKKGNGEYSEVLCLVSLPYFVDHKLGMDAAGKYFGVKTSFIGPAQFDIAGMISALEGQIAKGVSGLVVVGFDAALKPSINKAIAAGIPTVTVDADVPDSDRLAFLGTSNVTAGHSGGVKLLELMGGKGDVLIITKTGQSNLEERVQGYQSALTRGGARVVQVGNDESDAVKAASLVSDALRRFPNLAGIACVEAAGGTGAATALRETGVKGKVKVISMDRDVATLQAIRDGFIQASVAQKSALMTFEAVALLYQAQTLDLKITKDNKIAKVSQLPSNIDTGIELITAANVDQWSK